MTRKDYVLLADALRNACPAGSRDVCSPNSAAYTAWLAAVCGVSAALGHTNPRFDSDRFLLAAGVIESPRVKCKNCTLTLLPSEVARGYCPCGRTL